MKGNQVIDLICEMGAESLKRRWASEKLKYIQQNIQPLPISHNTKTRNPAQQLKLQNSPHN